MDIKHQQTVLCPIWTLDTSLVFELVIACICLFVFHLPFPSIMESFSPYNRTKEIYAKGLF